jgi:hypothetical protein
LPGTYGIARIEPFGGVGYKKKQRVTGSLVVERGGSGILEGRDKLRVRHIGKGEIAVIRLHCRL